jgi:phytoene dehydrogenase-like protein
VRYDALILGAGMSGLAAGIRLAHHGRRVAILERHSLWGGLNSFYKQAGRRFDVGLHALTNFVPPRTPRKPLTRVLRQLRLRHADLKLGEHRESEILFPGTRLAFSNDPARLESEVRAAFPTEIDRYRALVREVEDASLDVADEDVPSARAVLRERLGDARLIEMLLLPACYYGSAREDDLDWDLFVVLFRSLFLEGLAYPEGGVRTLLDLLLERYRSQGGELRMRTGVARILTRGDTAVGVVTDGGEELFADRIFSSAGWVETMRLCGRDVPPAEVGQLSFLESISVLDRPPAELGHAAAASFFCTEDRLRYRRPKTLVDVASGVVSAPTNYACEKPLPEGLMRVTVLADPDGWCELPEEEYRERKAALSDAAIESAATFLPDWRPHTVYRDVFTPRTIKHFTGHVNGAVYGSPRKRRSGETGVENLILCGTDQGYVGIIGALTSGIAMANLHALSGVRA